MMRKYMGMVLALALVWHVPAFGQELKVAFVDFQRIQTEFKDFQEAQAEFDKDVENWKSQLSDLEEEIVQKQTDYEKQKLLLSEEKRNEREKEISDKKLEYQQQSNNILGPGGRAEARQKALLDPILKKVNDAMALVASRENYSIIFEKSALAYAQDKLDITDKILQELERMQ